MQPWLKVILFFYAIIGHTIIANILASSQLVLLAKRDNVLLPLMEVAFPILG